MLKSISQESFYNKNVVTLESQKLFIGSKLTSYQLSTLFAEIPSRVGMKHTARL